MKDKEWLKEETEKLYKHDEAYLNQDDIVVENYQTVTSILELIDQLDEPEQVVCAENERTTQLVEVPQFMAETIEKYKENDDSLGELLSSVEHANIKYYHGMEKYRVNFNNSYPQIVDLCATIARAWLDGYTISPPKTLQVIVKNYDSTVFTTELPKEEAIKLIKGWKEDEILEIK